MIDKLPLQKISKRIFVILFLLINCLILCTNAHADVYCVGCSAAIGGTCTGAAGCGATCSGGDNGVVCPTIAAALTCIASQGDTDATMRIAQAVVPYTGPGSGNTIDNTAGADQVINIEGGYSDTCTTQTLDPSNTIIEAPASDRVFNIDNTTSDSLEVTLEGLTITGGDPTSPCGDVAPDNGGGVCAASTSGSGGLGFTSMENIYDGNSADNGGGLAVISGGTDTGVIIAVSMYDTFINNTADDLGGGILFRSTSKSLDATIDMATFGGSLATGNEASGGGGVGISATGDGKIKVSNQGNTISHNTANSSSSDIGGGGFAIFSDSSETLEVSIEQDKVLFNTAEIDQGGGITFRTTSNGTIDSTISKTEIGSNSAGTYGGGIALRGSGNINLFRFNGIDKGIVNNIIFKNLALGDSPGGGGGGGVAAVTDGTGAFFDIKFVNNTIADNLSTFFGAQGGGILADNAGEGRIDWTLPNDIIYFNSSQGSGNQIALVEAGTSCTPPSPDDCATLAVRASDLSQQPDDLFGTGVGQGFVNLLEGNIPSNPLFVDSLNNDYHIPSISPATDAGTKVAIITVAGIEAPPPPDDFDGVPRDISMGAFEPLPGPSPTPTPTPTPTVTPTVTPTATPTATPTVVPTPVNRKTFPNARNGKLVTIISPLGTRLSDVDAFRNLQGCPDGFNGQFLNFPIGSFEYVVSGLVPGGSTTVEIILPSGTTINSFFKFGPEPDNPEPHCYEFLFDGRTGAEIFNDRVILHFIDGERGDGDLVPNGVVVEPGGPALLSDEPIDTGGGCALAQTVQSGSALLNLLIPILTALAFGLRILRRKTVEE